MRRTQLYLDERLWSVLHERARNDKTTVSELVRRAVRERYLGPGDERSKAMREFIGIRSGWTGTSDSVDYVRDLRRGGRMDRLHKR